MAMVRGMEKEEKWIKHYSSSHKILLVGEGDISFSTCLARAFGSAANMVATSLDSKEELEQKYSKAAIHLRELEDRGCTIIHQVDANTMSQHHLLQNNFDRIIFNFPNATLISGEDAPFQIWRHQRLVKGFLENAAKMLSFNGEVHVTHKTTHPYDKWEIEELASQAGFFTHDKVEFFTWRYPGYCNKRGQAAMWYTCDDSFPAGECSTFMFKLQA